MTLNEFYEELKKTKKDLVWVVKNRGEIRGIDQNRNLAFSPLNAVLYFSYQTYLDNSLFFPIIHSLEMNMDDGTEVILASDNASIMRPEIRHKLEEILL